MAFITMESFCFEKNNSVFKFAFSSSLSICYLVSLLLILDYSHTTLFVFEEGAIKLISRDKILHYRIDSVFWQVLIEILFVFFLLFFLAA